MLKITNTNKFSSEPAFFYGQEIAGRLIQVSRPLTLRGNRNIVFWRTLKKCKPEAGTINEALSLCPACSLYGLRMLKVRGWRRGRMLDSRSEAALSAPSKHGSFSGASNAGWVSFTSSFFNLKRQQRESFT
jgi:hypothetical protein